MYTYKTYLFIFIHIVFTERGAANTHDKRNGLATEIRAEIPSALSVHCFAHSLNLCLQDAGRKLTFIRDALE